MTITELINALARIQTTFPNIRVRAEGWNEMGDLSSFPVHGDVRLERDSVGNPVVVIR